MLSTKRKYNTQPNIITNSTDEMSVIEKRLVYLAINQMDASINMETGSFKDLEFKIPISALGDTNYDRIRKAVFKLQSRAVVLIDDRPKRLLQRIIPFPAVRIENEVITLKMYSDIIPYFLELKKGFTKYELQAALALTSVYSQKLYEHFSRWKDKEKWSISFTDLQTLLAAENYRYADFKRRCLDCAVLEINEKTDLTILYNTEKEGRSVGIIHFTIKIKTRQDLQEANAIVEEGLAELSSMKPSEVAVIVQHLLHKYTLTKSQKESIISTTSLFNKFVELDFKIVNKIIDAQDPTRYIASSLFKNKT